MGGWWDSTSPDRRGVTVGLIIGLVVALVEVALVGFAPDWVKIASVVVLTVVGLLNFLGLLGTLQTWRQQRSTREYHARIRPRDDLVMELSRLDRRIHEVLYERRGDHPSLNLQGEQVISDAYSKVEASDFPARLNLLKSSYEFLHRRIVDFTKLKSKERDTLVFVRLLQEVCGHLDGVELGFAPVYVAGESRPIGEKARSEWHEFVTEYNEVLRQWKEFLDRVRESLSDGGETHAKPARDLGSGVR